METKISKETEALINRIMLHVYDRIESSGRMIERIWWDIHETDPDKMYILNHVDIDEAIKLNQKDYASIKELQNFVPNISDINFMELRVSVLVVHWDEYRDCLIEEYILIPKLQEG